jgi:diguanylate cyclase (GGDEF)-like protein
MRSNTDIRLLAPLAGAAIIAVLAIPASLAFVAATAGREDGQREARFLSASFSGYFDSLAKIEHQRLIADSRHERLPPPGQVGLEIDDRLRLTSTRRGPDAPGESAGLTAAALAAIRGLQTSPAPDGSYALLSWQGDNARLVVAARDPRQDRYLVAVKPISSAFLNATIGRRFEMRDLEIHSERPRSRTGFSSTSVRPADGGGAGFISWRANDMSAVILQDLLPVMSIAALVLTVLGAWLFRRTRRLTQEVLASQAHARHLALHDPLTGLANRALLANRADLAIEQRRRTGGIVAFFLLDLDRFKQVNDTLGHAGGDALIRIAAERLLQVCRATDTVARLGGDEFALVASVASAEAAEILAARIVEVLKDTVDVPGGQAQLSASVGLALVIDDKLDRAEALRQADLALYRAKAKGRGCYARFETEMDESLRLRRQTEADLRIALAAGDLEMHYQPQVTTRTGKLQSVEALVRWTHPVRGPVSPAYFIPIAEESGLIHELGDFVMRRACRDGLRWPDLKVAINVSPCQLKTADFPGRCRRILEEVGTTADRIELEITEGVLLDHGDDVLQTIRQLREMGFSIALDDFGTGYSSLNYLNVYAVDKIKIDRSFVDRIGAHQDAEKVIRAIIRLGKALGLQVIAEGVETEAQRAELAASGCTMIQGYLHAAPADAETIDRMVQSRTTLRAA